MDQNFERSQTTQTAIMHIHESERQRIDDSIKFRLAEKRAQIRE